MKSFTQLHSETETPTLNESGYIFGKSLKNSQARSAINRIYKDKRFDTEQKILDTLYVLAMNQLA